MLDRLAQLTADASPEGRRQLLHAVTDLFLVDADPSETAKDHYAGIAEHSLERLNADARASYAERVADKPTLPNSVARTLASDDDIAVASLVLRLSPVLTDADLAAIAVTHSQSHLVAIAERATLSESVTDILVERGDKTVLRTVSGNEGAHFSDSGINRLIERGADDAMVSSNLARRSDSLPPTQAQRVLQIAAQVSGAAGPSITSTGALLNPPKIVAKEARERRLEVKLLIADLKDNRRTIDEVVTMLAKQDRAFDLAQVISIFADIRNAHALRALLQPESSGIAIACRSLGLGAEAFRSVLQLRGARLNLSQKQIARDVELYLELPEETSERAMRFLKVRTAVH